MDEKVLAFYRDGRDAQLSRLNEFLRIPSISTDPAYRDKVALAARFVANELTDLGLELPVNIKVLFEGEEESGGHHNICKLKSRFYQLSYTSDRFY